MTYTEITKENVLNKLKSSNDKTITDFLLEILFLLINDHNVYVIQHKNKKYIVYDK